MSNLNDLSNSGRRRHHKIRSKHTNKNDTNNTIRIPKTVVRTTIALLIARIPMSSEKLRN